MVLVQTVSFSICSIRPPLDNKRNKRDYLDLLKPPCRVCAGFYEKCTYMLFCPFEDRVDITTTMIASRHKKRT